MIYTVKITNNCKQCGVKYGTYAIDPPVTKSLRVHALNKQKEYLATRHKGHDYKLKVENG